MRAGSVSSVFETMRRYERRAVALDRRLTWRERVLRALVLMLGWIGAALLWTQRGDLSMPWLIVAAASLLLVWGCAVSAFVVYQRNRVRRRLRNARQARRVAAANDRARP